ncbi:[FeFe] hydrogenase H-cluster maturation GTPase HydF [Pseudoramibacter alactolyticus]|uniref:[FeFe] hydrogenase H-cluster maturation GTPase HydF n=1 Tax=Pseudoramibacter alactolyticus TaxID=113287 RepID=UPI002353B2B0|nr:[FeFe] hydrogenase H-cluster maturation GTPase HydF [Pseudoramibacter alactolyticus]
MATLNDTPLGERVHIGFFGRRNAGKSSLVNAVTGQAMAVVSETAGTTTDPVEKTMELLPIGPVLIIDTPGTDDVGALGEKRVARAREVLDRTDIAVLVVDGAVGLTADDRRLLALFEEKQVPYLVVMNKCDVGSARLPADSIAVSARTGEGIEAFKKRLAAFGVVERRPKILVGDLVMPGDIAVLVIPIDSSAPKGRLILPQQMVIRDLLDAGATALCAQPGQLAGVLADLKAPPKLVITDSQVFKAVAKLVPEAVPLTSFSILMARYKGFLALAVAGAAAIKNLKDGDRVLIAEGCTHHRQCEDIGTVKLPRWLEAYTGARLVFETVSGKGFPEDLTRYALVVHCGGCMLGERAVLSRMRQAAAQRVPVTNYGVAIAQMDGILARSLAILPSLQQAAG